MGDRPATNSPRLKTIHLTGATESRPPDFFFGWETGRRATGGGDGTGSPCRGAGAGSRSTAEHGGRRKVCALPVRPNGRPRLGDANRRSLLVLDREVHWRVMRQAAGSTTAKSQRVLFQYVPLTAGTGPSSSTLKACRLEARGGTWVEGRSTKKAARAGGASQKRAAQRRTRKRASSHGDGLARMDLSPSY